MQYSETALTATDGLRLFVRRYECQPSLPGRTLLIVHGLSEHGRRYEHVARLCVDRGWNVIVGDLRGHGRSGGVPTHVENFTQYLRDLDTIWEHFALQPERTALLGHSTGSLIAIRYLERNPERAAAAVLLSPLLAVKVAVHPLTIALGKVLSVLAPRARFRSRVDPADTTRNEEVLAKRLDDPLIHRSVTARWYFQMKATLDSAWSEADTIRVPILVMQGERDRIVDPSVVEPWLENVGSCDKSLRFLPDHLHELHNEPDWPETLGTILEWLDARIPVMHPQPNVLSR